MAKPSEMDLIKAKWVLRYLRGTLDLKITYWRNKSEDLQGYTDSDWAGDYRSRRSMSGYLFILGGAAISWSSKRKATVALSNAEAEYMALAHAVQEVIFIRGILDEIGYLPKRSTKIYVDNQSCMKMATNQATSNCTKHIAIKYHFTREKIESQEITLEYLPAEEMLADILTKAVGQIILKRANIKIFGKEEVENDNKVNQCL